MSMIWQGSKFHTQRTGARVEGIEESGASDSRENVPFSVFLVGLVGFILLVASIGEALAGSVIQ